VLAEIGISRYNIEARAPLSFFLCTTVSAHAHCGGCALRCAREIALYRCIFISHHHAHGCRPGCCGILRLSALPACCTRRLSRGAWLPLAASAAASAQ